MIRIGDEVASARLVTSVKSGVPLWAYFYLAEEDDIDKVPVLYFNVYEVVFKNEDGSATVQSFNAPVLFGETGQMADDFGPDWLPENLLGFFESPTLAKADLVWAIEELKQRESLKRQPRH
jgi:hypothetical protein